MTRGGNDMDRYHGYELREIQLELKKIDCESDDAGEIYDDDSHLSPEFLEELFDTNEHWRTLIL